MSELKLQEYQANIPYLEDVDLFHATKKAIYIIVLKHGQKNETILRVARKDKVREQELRKCVEAAIPASFFVERAKKAKDRHERSFYAAPEVKIISESEKAIGLEKLSAIRQLLRS